MFLDAIAGAISARRPSAGMRPAVLFASGLALGCGVDTRSFSDGGAAGALEGSSGDSLGGSSGDSLGAAASGGAEGLRMGKQPLPEQPSGGQGGSPDLGSDAGGTGPEPVESALCAPPVGSVPPLALELVTPGLTQPVLVAAAPADDSRLFVLEKAGTVRVIVDGTLREDPFLDIVSLVSNQGERGLLGLAFHPSYAENGRFYLHYSSSGGEAPLGAGVVAEFQVSADPNLANPASRRPVLTVEQPEANHNGGMLTFGPDGLLYLGFGDGGGGNDQHGTIGNGQSLDTLLGKLLRLDVEGRSVDDAYGIPEGNLAQQTGIAARAEIWAYGLRNPWRFSFDACNGDLYIADVGQNAQEEIDYLPAGTPAGANFGWRIMEGPSCGPDGACTPASVVGLTAPIDGYAHDVGTSITGGYVYRGSAIPALRGQYIYADYASARFFRLRVEGSNVLERVEITSELRPGEEPAGIASFGQDNAGEIYVTSFDPGAVYRLVTAP